MQGINFAKKATCNRAIDANSGIPGETPDFRNVVYGFIMFRRMIMLTTVKLCGMIKPQVRKPAGVHSIALTTRRITMSKTTKLPFRRLSILGATVALIVGATTAAADDVTATVFTAANVEYANLRVALALNMSVSADLTLAPLPRSSAGVAVPRYQARLKINPPATFGTR